MHRSIHNTVYLAGASCALMDQVRREANYWAEGDESVCMTFEDAMEIKALAPFLDDIKEDRGDVILSL